MRIAFSPQRRDDGLEVAKAGDTLTINGDVLDLSVILDGDLVEDADEIHPMLTGSIERVAGQIHLTLILPHGPNPSAPVANPAPLVLSGDGPVPIPMEEA